jgi:hypothetical protein
MIRIFSADVAAIWFEISHIQHRCDRADDKAVKDENKQAATSIAPLV